MNICKRTIIMAAGAAVAALAVAGYQVTYDAWTSCGPQRWIDSSANGHGNRRLDGNIIGC
jgi:hypothetical protein